MVGVRHAQEGADHHGRHRQRERGDQVGRRALRDHRVEASVDDALDLGAQGVGALEREARGEPAALGAVLGVVDAEQGDAAAACGVEAGGGRREAGVGAVARQAGVREQGAGRGVAGDQPDLAAVEEGDAGQGAGGAQRVVGGGRVVGAGAVLREGEGGGLGAGDGVWSPGGGSEGASERWAEAWGAVAVGCVGGDSVMADLAGDSQGLARTRRCSQVLAEEECVPHAIRCPGHL
ncbi:hypothetical protein GCM10020256_04320 [Streptomyces thermocoprophilus]